MTIIELAKIKLNNHFPINLKCFYFKGVRIVGEDFE